MKREMTYKVKERLKKNGGQELILDVLDRVVGGSFTYNEETGLCTYMGETMTPEDFNLFWCSLAYSSGTDTAIPLLYKTTGYWCKEMGAHQSMNWNRGGEEARNKMGIILDQFWCNRYGVSSQ